MAAPSWRPTSAADSLESWPLVDRIGYRLAWATGGALCLVAGVLSLMVRREPVGAGR